MYFVLEYLWREVGFDMLVEMTAADYLEYPNATDRFGVMYVLLNTTTGERVIVKTYLNLPELELPSVYPLWKIGGLVGARGLRHVRDHVRRSSGPAADPDAGGVHGVPVAEGLSAEGARRAA